MKIKLSQWAKQEGISFKTAQRWYYTGAMPVRTEKTPTGRIMVVLDDPPQVGDTVIYACVSSADQKDDLQRQVVRLQALTAARGWQDVRVVTEIGSGLNGRRPRLIKLLQDLSVQRLVVEHRDRLARFGVEYIEAVLSAQQRQLVIAEQGDCKLDIVQDFVDMVTSMCARIYGRRAAKNRARRALEAADNEIL